MGRRGFVPPCERFCHVCFSFRKPSAVKRATHWEIRGLGRGWEGRTGDGWKTTNGCFRSSIETPDTDWNIDLGPVGLGKQKLKLPRFFFSLFSSATSASWRRNFVVVEVRISLLKKIYDKNVSGIPSESQRAARVTVFETLTVSMSSIFTNEGEKGTCCRKDL